MYNFYYVKLLFGLKLDVLLQVLLFSHFFQNKEKFRKKENPYICKFEDICSQI